MQNIAHTGSNYFNIVVKVLDLLYSGWKPKLHAITSDGAPVMMGVHSGINTQLKDLCQEVNSGDSILIIWCFLHNFTKEFSCGTQTAPVFPTVLNLQQVYASSANHHGVSARCRL